MGAARFRWSAVGVGLVVAVGGIVIATTACVVIALAAGGAATRHVAVGAWFLVAEVAALGALVQLLSGQDRNSFGLRRAPSPAADRAISLTLLAAGLLTIAGILICGAGTDMMIGLLPLVILPSWVTVASLALLSGRTRFLAGFTAASAVAMVLALFSAPSVVRLKVSEGDIAAAGREVIHGGRPLHAGSYGIIDSRSDINNCAVLITQTVIGDEHGLAYCPTPPPTDDNRFHHQFGELYTYAFIE